MRLPSSNIALILPVLVLFTANLSGAATFSNIYSFGDSLSDAGNLFIATGQPPAPYSNGRFSNGNVWVQDLASDLGMGPITPSLAGGTDYAVGGAQTGVTPVNAGQPIDLNAQLSAFHSAHATADPNALYTVWIGANDLFSILGSNPTAQQAGQDVAASVKNIDNFLSLLGGYGAKNVLLVTVPDLGVTPRLNTNPAASAAASGLSSAFNSALLGSLPAVFAVDPALQITTINSYSLIDNLVANPGPYGLTNVTTACFANNSVCSNQGQTLFWDSIHPTAVGHNILASDAFATLVPEPAAGWLTASALLLLMFVVRRRTGIC